MSWITRVKNGLTIRTGDGKPYKPFYINTSSSKNIDYNNTLFEFVNLPGTLVDRRLPKGAKYTLEFGFQGDYHLDKALEFVESAANTRYWVLDHPEYGQIFVQPISLNQDNSALNVSKFIVPVIETILDDVPKTKIDAVDDIAVKKLTIDAMSAEIVTKPLTEADKLSVKDTNTKNFNFSVPIVKLPEEFQQLMNAVSAANGAVDAVTANATIAMAAATSLITAPAKFAANVTTRLTDSKNQFTALKGKVVGLTSKSSKQVYQHMATSILSTMCLASSLPSQGDYTNAKRVGEVVKTLSETYTSFLEDLDGLQSINGGSPDSFLPNPDVVVALGDIINTTISYLYNEAIGSRKERSIIVENDTSIILLAHRFYGLDPDDKNIKELIENNDLSMEEYILIKKGRKIIYYI